MYLWLNNGCGIYDFDGWGIYELDSWGIYDVDGWGIYGLNGWDSYGKVSYCFMLQKKNEWEAHSHLSYH